MSSYNDTLAPKVFNVITSDKISYNMDFVTHLVAQEVDRRKVTGEPALSEWELGEYKRNIIRKLILQGDASAAVSLRPQTTRKQLNG